MIYLQLFWEFFQIGLFAVGGGMATLPFLQNLGARTGWFNDQLIIDMIAVSESTPGPIGINMATYVGYNIAGIPGAILATLGETIPSLIIVILVSKSLAKFRSNPYVDAAFYGLRPAVTGLIASAGLILLNACMLHMALYKKTGALLDLFDIKKILFFLVIYFAIYKYKKHPILYIAVSAVVGIVFSF